MDKKNKHPSIFDFVLYVLLIIYILFFVYFLLLKNYVAHSGVMPDMTRIEYISSSINIIPGFCFVDFIIRPVKPFSYVMQFIANIFGNIILFVPLGTFLPIYISKIRNTRKILISGLFVSLVIEAVQLFGMLGVFDIDDIWLNVLGVYIGFCLWKYIVKRLKDSDVFRYIS